MKRAIAKTKILGLVALAGASIVAGGGSPSEAAAVSINLCAVTGSVNLPGDSGVPIWAFTDGGNGPTPVCTAGSATAPGGPQLTTADGDEVTLNVANALGNGHELSFEIPGVTGPTAIADGDTATITFTATAGAHLYQSGGDAGRQEAMGLYGALIVHPTTANQAYGDASTAYDVEAPLVLSEIDPAFNADPDNFDMTNYLATYWLINGEAYPDTNPIAATAGQRVLLRYVNTGYDNTTKKYEGTWMDNASTGMMVSKGTMTGSVMTSSSTMADPTTGKMMTVKMKTTVADKDHYTMEMWGPGPDGKNYKMMEIAYSRKM